ncbi:MAG: YhcH/YjgK/YiaL family protein [Negativicutes bacterium]|nr:YhcH/YjgK/YiaL family protein [Negativicutes bacterium]
MILGHIDDLALERGNLPAAVAAALEYLRSQDLAQLPLGRHSIQDDDMYVTINEYKTEMPEKRKFEAHERYADIQYIIRGAETIGYARRTPELEIAENYLAERDLLFFRAVAHASELRLTAGMYVVLFPWDAHRPNCHYDGEQNVRKALVKIKMSLLHK